MGLAEQTSKHKKKFKVTLFTVWAETSVLSNDAIKKTSCVSCVCQMSSKSEWVENIASRFYTKVHYSGEASRGVYMEGY